MITAKPVVKDKYWILKDGEIKIGTLEKTAREFVVRVNDKQQSFPTIKTIKNRTGIVFEEPEKPVFHPEFQVNGFPTDSKPYNAVYNVQNRLPLFNKKNKSKSWYAAGYYQITIDGITKVHYCPKLILLQRYDYRGPAKSPDGFTFL